MHVQVTLQNGVVSTDVFVKLTDTHQYLDPASRHPYHCKKGMPFGQILRLKMICSNNINFDKRCNELKEWLLAKGYNEKIVVTV